MYRENPKTKGSGILTCIPQKGKCRWNCPDCFFQSGRSYLEPLDENLPNMPYHMDAFRRVVRVNDGQDSLDDVDLVKKSTQFYDMKFYNTAQLATNWDILDAPFVLTVNPSKTTDVSFYHVPPPMPRHLMFVRVRTNTWNLDIVRSAVAYYTNWEVPVVLTFMAYYNTTDKYPPHGHASHYTERVRTKNSYKAITFEAWKFVMKQFELNRNVHSCGREGVASGCRYCGNCLREYFTTMERLRGPLMAEE